MGGKQGCAFNEKHLRCKENGCGSKCLPNKEGRGGGRGGGEGGERLGEGSRGGGKYNSAFLDKSILFLSRISPDEEEEGGGGWQTHYGVFLFRSEWPSHGRERGGGGVSLFICNAWP